MELSGDTSRNKVGYRYGHSITGLLGRPPKSTASEKGYRYPSPSKSVELSGDTSMKKKLGIVTTTIVGCWPVRLEAQVVRWVIVTHRNPMELSGVYKYEQTWISLRRVNRWIARTSN